MALDRDAELHAAIMRRRRAERRKARLNARHAAGPDDYLSDAPTPPPPPTRRAGWINKHISAKPPRKHRRTGASRGHPIHDDTSLAAAVHKLQETFDYDHEHAVCAVADSLVRDTAQPNHRMTDKAALARVRRALARQV
jgi:hypothetical protein